MAAEQKTTLERELSELLTVESFDPPEEFRERALLSDPAIYEEAAADPEAWWLRQATELLDWFEAAERERSTTPIPRSTSGSPTAA